MSFQMNMLSMYHVHYISKETEGIKPTIVPKNTAKITNQASFIIQLQDVKYNWQNNPNFSCSQKCDFHKMAEIEKEAVGFPVIYHLVAGEFI